LLLAEAIKEKVYLEEAIANYMEQFMFLVGTRSDSVKIRNNQESLLKEKKAALNDLYQKCQKFAVAIERSRAKVIIKVNDMELSLIDAITLRDALRKKYDDLRILKDRITAAQGSQTNADIYDSVNDLYSEMEKILLNVKTLEFEIDYASWSNEVI
jgi:hypothetical protein